MHTSVQEAAAAIVELVNTRPRSPTQAQIEAILERAWAGPRARAGSITVGDGDAWLSLIAEHDAAHAVSGNIQPGDVSPETEALAEAVTAAADGRLSAFHKAVWQKQAHTWADVGFLAEICFRIFWPGCDLRSSTSGALLADGPHCREGVCDDALGALLRAIRDVTRPLS